MKPKIICTCPVCLRAITYSIELAFMLEPRPLAAFTIRAIAHLDWVPSLLYSHIIGRLCELGVLIRFVPDDPANKPVRYLHYKLMTPVRRRPWSQKKGRKE
jgi:hypothetical protein